MSSKEMILQALKHAQSSNPLPSAQPKHFDTMIYDREDLLSVYLQYQRANMAKVIESSEENLASDINALLKENGINELLCARNILDSANSKKSKSKKSDSIESSGINGLYDSLEVEKILYEKSVDETRERLFNIKASILHACVGVANLGILGLATSSVNPRLASLVVETCIILLKKDDIVPNLFAAFERLKVAGDENELPTNIVFLAGPSRTADIELQTVFGVHGPQHIFVVLY